MSDPGKVVRVGSAPFVHELAQRHGVDVPESRAADHDVVVAVAVDCVGAHAADQNIAVVAPREKIVPTTAQDDVVALTALNRVVAGSAVQDCRQGDTVDYLDGVITSSPVGDQSRETRKRAQLYA